MTETENPKTFFQYQIHFMVWLTDLDDRRAAESLLSNSVDERYLHRLETYQASYLGRITANLSETIFEACENLFGKEFVAHVFAGFFKSQPPRAADLTSAADELPAILRQSNQSREALLFADVADLCTRRWSILTDTDDNDTQATDQHSLENIFLRSGSQLLMPSGAHDLAAAWSHAAYSNNGSLPEIIFTQRRAVLLGKNHHLQFQVVAIAEPFEPFAQALIDGLSVAASVDILESELALKKADESDLTEEFQNLLATLTQLDLLKVKL
jgi:hypothetical protein